MNYKHLIVSAFVLGCVGQAYGQSEPTKANYDKKVYENGGNTYVQKSLPVYLKFSTTPDGENIPLRSKQHPTDANPMYLDTEGVNYIRSKWAVDPESKNAVSPQREVMMELYADGMAPMTSRKFYGAPKYVAGGTTFYGKGLMISLSSKDAVSGVSETQYALGGNYMKYASPISAGTEGAQTLFYYSADNVGNAEGTKSNDFTVDLTNPTSSHAVVGISYQGTILAPSTMFSLTSEDNLSGVNNTKYSFDEGANKRYSSKIGMGSLADGEHTLYYFAEDNVENIAEKSSFTFYLDRIAPETAHEIVGDQYKGKYLYVSPRTTVQLSATDNKAGVKNIYYRIDGKERFIFGEAFKMPNVAGLHTVKYDANDNVENLSGNTFVPLYMDNNAPETGIFYGNPQFFDRDTLFIADRTPITLKPRDGESGVQKTMYAIDGAGNLSYSEAFKIADEGFHTITFNSTDNVNNEEQVKTSTVFVDKTPPEIYSNFSIKPIGTKGGLNIYPNYVRMYLGATDAHTGTESVMYSIDDAPMTQYSSPRTLDVSELGRFKKNKKYVVRVVAKDKLGNESEQTFEFYVGKE